MALGDELLTEQERVMNTQGQAYLDRQIELARDHLARVNALGGGAYFATLLGLSPAAKTEVVDALRDRFQDLSIEESKKALDAFETLNVVVPAVRGAIDGRILTPSMQSLEKPAEPVLPAVKEQATLYKQGVISEQPELDIPAELHAFATEESEQKDAAVSAVEPEQAQAESAPVVQEQPLPAMPESLAEGQGVVETGVVNETGKTVTIAADDEQLDSATKDSEHEDLSKTFVKSTRDYIANIVGEFDEAIITTNSAEALADFFVLLRGVTGSEGRSNAFPYRDTLMYRFQNMTPTEIGRKIGRSSSNVIGSLGNFSKFIQEKYSGNRDELTRLFQEAFGIADALTVEANDAAVEEPEIVVETDQEEAQIPETPTPVIVRASTLFPVPTPPKVAMPTIAQQIESQVGLERVTAVAGALAEAFHFDMVQQEQLQKFIDPSRKHGLVKVDEETVAVVTKMREFLFQEARISLKDPTYQFDDKEYELLRTALAVYEKADSTPNYARPVSVRTIVHAGEARNINEELAQSAMTAFEKLAAIAKALRESRMTLR